MSVIYLIVYILLFSFIISALSGVIMFVVDIIRFGKPHSKFECVPSIEAYNDKFINDSSSEDETPAEESIEIDL